MFSRCLCLLAVFAAAQGRAVNISNTWVLPEEGFPVFYRYFRDRISWYEADAVCQFHHANLVTVDTTAQYDAVRAYLKELDITSAVWVGLIRSNPDGEFTWTDYRGMSGDGYWSSAPDARTAPLCAAANPSADYRWEARACGGPTVASFICELPVPQWALGNEGCMVRNLPALTVLYLPESAAVQLTADCGLAGVKRVQCTGSIKRELLLKNLSCVDSDDASTTPPVSIQGITWPITTESIVTDQDIINDVSTEEVIITTVNKDKTTSTASTNASGKVFTPVETKSVTNPDDKNLHRVYLNKQINLETLSNNNEQRNDIPQIGNDVDELIEEETAKLEDARNLQHKLLHDELARRGNFENIFTQSSDHFVPPLVMAKAKVSDDMTVLSLAQKHAQQLAEYRTSENKASENTLLLAHKEPTEKSPPVAPSKKVETSTEVQSTTTEQYTVLEQTKNVVKVKNNSPKKYNEKNSYTKGKYPKTTDTKIDKINFDKPAQVDNQNQNIQNKNNLFDYNTDHKNISEDNTLDLTVVLQEPENHSKDIQMDVKTDNPTNSQISSSTTEQIETTKYSELPTKPVTNKLNINDEIIKITVVKEAEDKNPFTVKVFDITTRNPLLDEKITTLKTTESTTELALENHISTHTILDVTTMEKDKETTTEIMKDTVTSENKMEPALQDTKRVNISDVTSAFVDINSTSEIPSLINGTTVPTIELLTDFLNISAINASVTEASSTLTSENIPEFNHTELHEGHAYEGTEEPYDDLNSPLLSAASEPLHRPPRLRRPQQTNHAKKFNPFRILG